MSGQLRQALVSHHGLEDARLLRLIRASYTASQGVYGAPRVFLDLRNFLSPSEFQWQSQNQTAQSSKHGGSIRDHKKLGIAVHLFVRQRSKTPDGTASPFVYCGPVDFLDWTGNKPTTVNWRLRLDPISSHRRWFLGSVMAVRTGTTACHDIADFARAVFPLSIWNSIQRPTLGAQGVRHGAETARGHHWHALPLKSRFPVRQ